MIAATLFSGIGAPECAMPHWDWRWCAEIEKFPSAVLRARYPHSINLGDVNAEDFVERAEKIGRPDVLVFGSPCQDFSVAGRRVGLDGDRGNLALVALGIVNRLRTRWVVFENVPGLLSSRSGSAEAERAVREGPVGGRADSDEDSDFAAFLSLVQQCGYLGCYRVTDAQYAGVPQRRRRIFAVFHIGDWRPAAAVLFEREGMRGDHPPSRETGEGITHAIAPSLTSSGRGVSRGGDTRGQDPVVAVDDRRSGLNPDGPVGAVSSKWSKGSGGPAGDECYNLVASRRSPVAFNGRQDPDVYGDRTGPLDTDPGTQVIAFDTTQITHPENRSQPDDRSPQLSQSGHAPTIAFTSKDYGGDAAIEQSPTLRAMEFDGSHANGGGQVAVAIPILEAGARTGKSTTDVRAGLGVAEDGDPMFTLQAGKQHAVAFQTRFARNGRGSADELVPALNGADAGATSDMRPCVAVFKPSHFTRGKDGAPSGVSPPLGAEPDKGDQDALLMTGTAVRRLTPKECERLQAFPDNWTLIPYRGAPAADGPRYKALGNAMNVNEIRWVLERIEKFEREVTKGGG